MKENLCIFSSDIYEANAYMLHDLSFITEIQSFVKEKIDLERDFAKRLESLSRKYQSKILKAREKLSKRHGIDEEDEINQQKLAERETSLKTGWLHILKETEDNAKSHWNLAELLNSRVVVELKSILTEKDEYRKKHLKFSKKLLNERDRIYSIVSDSRDKYHSLSANVILMKKKFEKIWETKSSEKLKSILHQEVLDMNNAKNDYILACKGANAVQLKYFKDDIPELLRNMKNHSESIIQSIKNVFIDYNNCIQSNSDEIQHRIDQMKIGIDLVNPEFDLTLTKKFDVRDYQQGLQTPFEFQSSGIWKENNNLALDANSRIYLFNKTTQLKNKCQMTFNSIDTLEKGIQGLIILKEAYEMEIHHGNPEHVSQEIIQTKRDMNILEYDYVFFNTQIQHIQPLIKDIDQNAKLHLFKTSRFTLPAQCDYCSQMIWTMTRPGCKCTACGSFTHLKCEMKVPPICPGMNLKQKRQNRSRSMTLPHFEWIRKDSNTSETTLNEEDTSLKEIKAQVLFDYIPTSKESHDLYIKKGDTVYIIEEDASGWTKVRLNSKTGLVPTSYVEPMSSKIESDVVIERNKVIDDYLEDNNKQRMDDVDDDPITEHETKENKAPAIDSQQQSQLPGEPMSTTVLFDYVKNDSDEITVYAGENVLLLIQDDGSGWTMISNGSKESGYVPSTYLFLI